MHTYVYPLSSAINKGASVHVCSFFCTERRENESVVTHSGTLVLDEKGYVVLNCENVVTRFVLLSQKMAWFESFKPDHLINKWIKNIQSDFSKGDFLTLYDSSDRVNELRQDAKELMKLNEKFIFIRNTILFKHILECGRVVWKREIRSL